MFYCIYSYCQILVIVIVLHSIGLCFIDSCSHLLIHSPFLAPSCFPVPSGNHEFLLYIGESVSLLLYSLIYFLDSTYKGYQTVLFFLCLTCFTKLKTLQVRPCCCNGKISLFFYGRVVFHCIYTPHLYPVIC